MGIIEDEQQHMRQLREAYASVTIGDAKLPSACVAAGAVILRFEPGLAAYGVVAEKTYQLSRNATGQYDITEVVP